MSPLQIHYYESVSNPRVSLSGMASYERSADPLKFSEDSTADISVELQHLPSALQSLSLDGLHVNPSTISAMKCTSLTYLQIARLQNSGQEVADLRSRLPALRVRILA